MIIQRFLLTLSAVDVLFLPWPPFLLMLLLLLVLTATVSSSVSLLMSMTSSRLDCFTTTDSTQEPSVREGYWTSVEQEGHGLTLGAEGALRFIRAVVAGIKEEGT